MTPLVDTHAHLDGEEFAADLPDVIGRFQAAGISRVFLPAIDLPSARRVMALSCRHPDVFRPMAGLHPEEVRADWADVLRQIEEMLQAAQSSAMPYIAVGEVGLDYYWSREYEKEQLAAFEQQVIWSVRYRLPLMIHCRKAQNEMVHILKTYRDQLPGGVFHCFTGNAIEAAQLLDFPQFSLGIGGVITFKKSHLPEVVRDIPLDRIVLETDSPYMAPVPMRGKRNESAYVRLVAEKIAESKLLPLEEIARQTTANVARIFGADTLK